MVVITRSQARSGLDRTRLEWTHLIRPRRKGGKKWSDIMRVVTASDAAEAASAIAPTNEELDEVLPQLERGSHDQPLTTRADGTEEREHTMTYQGLPMTSPLPAGAQGQSDLIQNSPPPRPPPSLTPLNIAPRFTLFSPRVLCSNLESENFFPAFPVPLSYAGDSTFTTGTPNNDAYYFQPPLNNFQEPSPMYPNYSENYFSYYGENQNHIGNDMSSYSRPDQVNPPNIITYNNEHHQTNAGHNFGPFTSMEDVYEILNCVSKLHQVLEKNNEKTSESLHALDTLFSKLQKEVMNEAVSEPYEKARRRIKRERVSEP